MGRLPEVIYFVDTPRATSGCASSSLSCALSAAVFVFAAFFCRLLVASLSESLEEQHQ